MTTHDDFFHAKTANSSQILPRYINKSEELLPHKIHTDMVEEEGKTATAEHMREVLDNLTSNPSYDDDNRIYTSKDFSDKSIAHPLSAHLVPTSDGTKYDVSVVHWLPKQKDAPYISYRKRFINKEEAEEHFNQLNREIPETYKDMPTQYKKLSNGMKIKYSIFDKLKKIITKSKPVEKKPVGNGDNTSHSWLWSERKSIQQAMSEQGENPYHPANKGLTNKAVVGIRKVVLANPDHPAVQKYKDLQSEPQISQTHSLPFNKLKDVMHELLPLARQTDPEWQAKYLENKAFHDKLAENVLLNSSIPPNTNLKSSIPADSHPTRINVSIPPAIDTPLPLASTMRKGKSSPSFVEKGEIPISTIKGKGRTKGEMGVGGKRHQFIAKQLSDGVPPNEIVQNLSKEFLLTPRQASSTYRQFKIKAKLRRILSEIKYKYSRIKYTKDDDTWFMSKFEDKDDNLPHLVHADELEEKGLEHIANHIRNTVDKGKIYSGVAGIPHNINLNTVPYHVSINHYGAKGSELSLHHYRNSPEPDGQPIGITYVLPYNKEDLATNWTKIFNEIQEHKKKYARKINYNKQSPFGFAPHQSVLDTLLHLRLKQEFETGKIKPGVAFDLTPHAESLLHSDLGAFAKKPDVQHLLGKTATMDADGKIHIIDPNSLDKTHVSSVPVKTQTEKQKQLTDELDKKLDEIMKKNHLHQKPLVQVNKHPAKIEPPKPTGQVSSNPPQIKLPTTPQVSQNPPTIKSPPKPAIGIAKPKLPIAKPPQPETAKRADTIGNHPTTVAAAISREAKPFVPIKTPSFIPRQLKPHEDMEFQEGDPVIHSISPEGERHVFVPNAGPKNNALEYATDALQAAGHHILGNRGLTQEEADHINRSGQHPHTVTYPLKEFMDKANQMGITPNSGSPKKTKGPDVRKPRKANKPPTEERQQWSRNTLDKIDYMADRLLEKIA